MRPSTAFIIALLIVSCRRRCIKRASSSPYRRCHVCRIYRIPLPCDLSRRIDCCRRIATPYHVVLPYLSAPYHVVSPLRRRIVSRCLDRRRRIISWPSYRIAVLCIAV
mmetsp:Transcript_24194/g.29332  ORF Transcript_24194/g.29332 Transcript_24194/m.29332 type:complete len:108 (-) Transcript_24194:10-333(-)